MAQLKDLLVNGSARVIGSLFANLSGNVLNFGVCSTAAATAAKTVTTNGTFELITGSKILVLFSETDSSNAPTLNVNGTGAKSIKINASDGIGKGFLVAQQYYWFVYDGTNWRTAGGNGNININAGTANRMAYYSGANIISAAARINYLNNIEKTYNSQKVYQNGLRIWGTTYGNTANQLIANTAGIIRYGDGGPQIQFSTGETEGQDGALIFTDHDAAGTGVSFHFVSNQGNDNNGGELTVTAPRFRARKGLTIGQNSDNTSYKLYVNGTSYFTETITGDIISAWHLLAGRPSNTTNFRTYFENASNLHHDDPARTDSEVSYNRWFANNSDQTNYSPAKLNLPVVDQHVLSFGIDNVAAYSRHIAFDIRTNAVYVGARNGNTWSNWEQLVRNTGTWNISITGNANTVDNLHASDFVRAYNTTNDNIDSDWGQSIKTFDPIPSGTPPEQNPNITLLSLGNSFARRKELAFTYSNNNIYYRRRTDNTFSNWVKLIHSGNYTDYTVTKTGSGATGTWNISITGNANTVDGWHMRYYGYKNTYNKTQPSANTEWYLHIKTYDYNHDLQRIEVETQGDNKTGELVLFTGSRSNNFWGYTTSYNFMGILGIKRTTSAATDIWLKINATCTSLTIYTTVAVTITEESTTDYISVPSGGIFGNTATFTTLNGNLAKKLTIQANGTQKGQFNNSADVTVNLGNVAQDFTGANSGNANNIKANTFDGMTKQQWLNTIYPIGSIYMSVNATSPAMLFGGKWEQLKDCFLLSAGDTYKSGDKGGEANHILSVDEMPAHSHDRGTMNITGNIQSVLSWQNNGNVTSKAGAFSCTTMANGEYINPDGWSNNNTGTRRPAELVFNAADAWTGRTSSVGSGKAHNNMPPYLTVYMWKRTA